MKWLLASLAANLISLSCVIGAIVIAISGKDGWGWFLLVAVICESSIVVSDSVELPEVIDIEDNDPTG